MKVFIKHQRVLSLYQQQKMRNLVWSEIPVKIQKDKEGCWPCFSPKPAKAGGGWVRLVEVAHPAHHHHSPDTEIDTGGALLITSRLLPAPGAE